MVNNQASDLIGKPKANLITITQKALESINNGRKMIGIFFGFASVFDTVWHKGLVYKLVE